MHSHTGYKYSTYVAIEMLKHPVHTVSHLGMNIRGGGSCQYKPRLAQMFRNGKTVYPNDAMLQLAQSILKIGFTLVERWDMGGSRKVSKNGSKKF